jgi:predicted metal-dependent peptidase
MKKYEMLNEAFESRIVQKGTIQFKNHKISDPHIQDTINLIAKTLNVQPTDIVKEIEGKIEEFQKIADLAPILYGTIVKNIVEDEVFKKMQEAKPLIEDAPKFDASVFWRLIRLIKADHDQFLPLRSFLNPKRLYQPVILLTPDPKRPDLDSISTAAASPKGEFYFNVDFMQDLINFAHVKGLKPKGLKYVSNGGKIPNEYGWIEFLIMHEFLHYVYDDFHYQKIIPNANHKIINWVGDFRSNYLLVKSGYEQLPIGLFNDDINYDRQRTYQEMYDLVKSELEKLPDDDGEGGEGGEGAGGAGGAGKQGSGKGKGKSTREKVEDALDKMGDDHEPGQDQAKGMEEGNDEIGAGSGTNAIDEHHKKVQDRIEKGSDESIADAEKKIKEQAEANAKNEQASKGGRGKGSDANPQEIDYTKFKAKPWKELLKQFIASAGEEVEETYQKPSRRSISGLHTAVQTGAGAMKPGELVLDAKEVKLAFIVDSSGSMGGVIGMVYANIVGMLKSKPAISNALFTLIKFSDNYHVWKAFFKRNTCVQVRDVLEKPSKFDEKTDDVFKKHFGSVTNFGPELRADIQKL